ncbi:hypothetical protein FB451DRAFT_1235775 [Mycena latifolia]|nr:hypothetical protein FB451DRAFT_1235775 [Mycena latifolia]
MDEFLGVDKTPKKAGQAETKPFTNFGVFHDKLITRLKALSQIHVDFDRRAKEVEACFADKLNSMRKQLDMWYHQWRAGGRAQAGAAQPDGDALTEHSCSQSRAAPQQHAERRSP